MRNARGAHVVVSSDTFGSFPVPYSRVVAHVEHRHPTVWTWATTRMNTRPRKPQDTNYVAIPPIATHRQRSRPRLSAAAAIFPTYPSSLRL
jgi:hypothetical protein